MTARAMELATMDHARVTHHGLVPHVTACLAQKIAHLVAPAKRSMGCGNVCVARVGLAWIARSK